MDRLRLGSNVTMNTSQYLQLKNRRRSIKPRSNLMKVTDAVFSETSQVNGKAKIFNLSK